MGSRVWAVAGGSRDDVGFVEFHEHYLHGALGSGSDDSCEHERALGRVHQEDRSGLSLSVCPAGASQGLCPAHFHGPVTSFVLKGFLLRAIVGFSF